MQYCRLTLKVFTLTKLTFQSLPNVEVALEGGRGPSDWISPPLPRGNINNTIHSLFRKNYLKFLWEIALSSEETWCQHCFNLTFTTLERTLLCGVLLLKSSFNLVEHPVNISITGDLQMILGDLCFTLNFIKASIIGLKLPVLKYSSGWRFIEFFLLLWWFGTLLCYQLC